MNLKRERYKDEWDTRHEIASVVREFRESEWVPMGISIVSTNASTYCSYSPRNEISSRRFEISSVANYEKRFF